MEEDTFLNFKRFVYDWLRTFPTENVRLMLKIIDCRNFQIEILPAINYTLLKFDFH